MGCRSWSFDLRYLLGRPPWDTAVTPPEVVELIEGKGLAPGRALDLGCGTGTNCIYLARHGWEVVGVDFSILAIRRARRKARWAGVDCQFYREDVADLAFLADPFDLALDVGCLHSLPPERWKRYTAEVARLLRPGGLYLLYAVNRRPEPVETQRELVTSEYDDVRPFVVTVLTLEHLTAEKVRALLVRGKPRDLYDVWLLLSQGVSPDQALIERKLALYGMAFSTEALEEALNRVRADWERDLHSLLPQFVTYEDVRQGVESLKN